MGADPSFSRPRFQLFPPSSCSSMMASQGACERPAPELGEKLQGLRDMKWMTTMVSSNMIQPVTKTSIPLSASNYKLTSHLPTSTTPIPTRFYVMTFNARTAFKVFTSLHPTFAYMSYIGNGSIFSETEERSSRLTLFRKMDWLRQKVTSSLTEVLERAEN